MTLDASYSSSIGTPVEGRIEGGVPLPLHGPGFRFNPAKRPERRHGTVELVQALVRASAVVHEELPGNPVTISDISMPDGGDIVGHASHRSGRDVDVYFYLLTADEQPFPAKAIPLEPDGTGHEYGDLAIAEDDVEVRLDVPRTWKFMEALVSDPDARINHILVAEHIRTLLLKHAEKIGAPEAARTRFGHLTCQPRFPHDDHVHIRFFCSADDIEAGCEDTRPIYPWHQAHLDDAGVQVRIAGKRKSAGPKLTSVKAARKKAAAGIEMHQDVIAFLDRRETWAKKPRSGRKYCR
jgi:penicillin-insensitive murein endopeptidase